MSTASINEHPPILVELKPKPGVQQVALTPSDLAERSAEALASATSTVQAMADWVNTTVDDLAGNPDAVQVEFGITLNVEGQALIAKAGAEAAISVTLTWKRGRADGE
jgi:hypothetical protein